MQIVKNLLNKYVKNNEIFSRFVNVFSVDVLVRGTNFLLIPVFLSLMTQEEYGIYGYLYSFSMTLSGIFSFGLYFSLIKLYADTNEDKTKQASMLFTITTTLISMVIFSLLIIYFTRIDIDFFSFLNKTVKDIRPNFYINYRIWVFITIISMIFTTYTTFYFASSEQIRKLQAFNLIRLCLTNIISIIVLYYSDLDKAMLRLAIVYSIELLLTIIFSSFLFKKSSPVFNIYYLKKGLKIGLPVTASSFVYIIMIFGDKFFAMKYAGVNQYAVYNLGVTLMGILLVVFQSFTFVWTPIFMKEKDLSVLKRKTQRYIIMIFLGLSFLGILVWIITFLALDFGIIKQKYDYVLYILPILLLSSVFSALIGLMINFLTYFEKTYIQFFVGLLLTFIGYFVFDYFTKYYNILGTSIALLLLNILSFMIYYFRVNYYISNRLEVK